MRNARIVAWNTALELLRNRVLYTILAFGLFIILAAQSFSHFRQELQVKLVEDISFTAINYFTMFLALFLTMDQLSNEIERKTVYFVLTRPVHRLEFLAGKFLGVNSILIANLVIMGGLLFGILAMAGHKEGSLLFLNLLLIYCQAMMLSASVILLTTFLSNILAVTFALFLYFFGTASATLSYGLEASGGGHLSTLLEALQFILPNFNLFDLQDAVLAGTTVTLRYVALLVGYAVLYTLNLLILSHVVFHRRDL